MEKEPGQENCHGKMEKNLLESFKKTFKLVKVNTNFHLVITTLQVGIKAFVMALLPTSILILER